MAERSCSLTAGEFPRFLNSFSNRPTDGLMSFHPQFGDDFHPRLSVRLHEGRTAVVLRPSGFPKPTTRNNSFQHRISLYLVLRLIISFGMHLCLLRLAQELSGKLQPKFQSLDAFTWLQRIFFSFESGSQTLNQAMHEWKLVPQNKAMHFLNVEATIN